MKKGACTLAEAMLNVLFLHCKLNSINSLIERLVNITNNQFEITEAKNSDHVTKGNGPWKIRLKFNNIEVIVTFHINTNLYIEKIDVEEI